MPLPIEIILAVSAFLIFCVVFLFSQISMMKCPKCGKKQRQWESLVGFENISRNEPILKGKRFRTKYSRSTTKSNIAFKGISYYLPFLMFKCQYCGNIFEDKDSIYYWSEWKNAGQPPIKIIECEHCYGTGKIMTKISRTTGKNLYQDEPCEHCQSRGWFKSPTQKKKQVGYNSCFGKEAVAMAPDHE